MATRSKAKTGSRKKPTKHNKPVKKKAHKHKAGLTLGIGIISTIKVGTPLRTAFRNGLNNTNVVIKVAPSLSYAPAKLQKEITTFNNDPQIGLIITVGGLLAYEAAESLATKPFLSLIGTAPANPGPQCYGGVSLQSYLSDPDRVSYLVGKGFSKTQIGLFYNPNSPMAHGEIAAWTGATPAIAGGVDAVGNNDSAAYTGDFAGIAAAITALVVSADPFFQDSKNDLVTAANSTGKYICYPLQDYSGATPSPTHLKATLYGPALADSYKLLGVLAANVLSTGTKSVFTSPLNTITDM